MVLSFLKLGVEKTWCVKSNIFYDSVIGRQILKKFFLVGLVVFVCVFAVSFADAAKKAEPVPENPYDWEISMQPKPTAEEQEAARWSLILENDLGIYAYDMSTLKYFADKKGKWTRTVLTLQ